MDADASVIRGEHEGTKLNEGHEAIQRRIKMNFVTFALFVTSCSL